MNEKTAIHDAARKIFDKTRGQPGRFAKINDSVRLMKSGLLEKLRKH
ncbi:hypothetical protein C7S16_5773 [Burkholderia thailandensis]|uniref:Uncharacterized protein n=1 Tax=Burkholderia thailandensis TaxID=57975 RepID=A0AAW9CR61_BURTH|nr:hypothetical protein [Burkholderia thailandensis]